MATSAGLAWSLANGITQAQYDQNLKDAYIKAVEQNLTDAQIRSSMEQYGVSPTDLARATGVTPASVQARYDVAVPTTAAEIAYDKAADAELAVRQAAWDAQQVTNTTDWAAQQAANEAAWAAAQAANSTNWAEQQRLNAINNANQIAANEAAWALAQKNNVVNNQKQITTNELEWAAKQRQNELDWAAKQRQNALDWAKQQAGATPLEAAPVGQFRELFPSFAESKRLAGEMVAGRPTTQSIVDMIQGGNVNPTYRPPPVNAMPVGLMDAWKIAETSGNYGNVANMLKGLNVNDLRNYGASPADIAYITSRPQIAGMFPTATPAAAPSLNNVLSMIGK
jgi:hypothetical protein